MSQRVGAGQLETTVVAMVVITLVAGRPVTVTAMELITVAVGETTTVLVAVVVGVVRERQLQASEITELGNCSDVGHPVEVVAGLVVVGGLLVVEGGLLVVVGGLLVVVGGLLVDVDVLCEVVGGLVVEVDHPNQSRFFLSGRMQVLTVVTLGDSQI